MELIDISCKNFFASYSINFDNSIVCKSFIEFVNSLKHLSHYENVAFLANEQFVKIMEKINELMNIYFVVENETTSFFEIFEHMMTEHFHQIKKDDNLHVCTFHMESLFVHSHLAFVHSLLETQNLEIHQRIKHAFIALIHDIGKVNTSQVLGKNISFPFHGEVGASILLLAYNEEFSKHFTKEEWNNIARTVCIHMCGYKETELNEQTFYKWNLFRLENVEVKNNLCYLSCDDNYGTIPKEISIRNDKEFDMVRKDFRRIIHEEYENTIFKNFIVYIHGADKDLVVQNFSKYLHKHEIYSEIIDRREILCQVMGEKNYEKAKQLCKQKKLDQKVYTEIKRQISQIFGDKKIVINPINEIVTRLIPSYVQGDKYLFPINIYSVNDVDKILPEGIENCLQDMTSVSSKKTINGLPLHKSRMNFVVTSNCNFDDQFLQLEILFKTLKTDEPKNKDDNFDLSIIEYVNKLYKNGGTDNVIQTLKNQKFHVNKLSPQLIMIKYCEGLENWAKWARQSRGVVLYFNKKTWVNVKYLLQRGSEMVTGYHTKSGINETESFHTERIHLFDHTQKDTYDCLKNNKHMDAAISFKLDGSLLGVTMYSNKYYGFAKNIIKSSDSDFSKLISEMAQEMNLPFVPIVSTNGTFIIGEFMVDYMITAILSNCVENVDKLDKTSTSLEMFKQHGSKFLDQLHIFYEEFIKLYQTNGIISIGFEAICKNRQACFGDIHVHDELAVSYPFTSIQLLSTSFGDEKITSIPHFVSSDIIFKSSFKEPLWWKINNGNKVSDMLNDLSSCLRTHDRQKEESNFLKKYVPDNKYNNKLDTFHYEGFVLYSRNGIANEYDYNKVKTEEYYKAHKYRKENITYLSELGVYASDIFPITKIVNFFANNFNDTVDILCKNIKKILNEEVENNILYKGLPEKAQISYKKQSHENKIKMLINASNLWYDVAYDEFVKIIPQIKESSMSRDNINKFIRGFAMEAKLWTENNFLNNEQIIGEIFNCLCQSTTFSSGQ
jgi:hypothetical protein